jgi:hypothetical protein
MNRLARGMLASMGGIALAGGFLVGLGAMADPAGATTTTFNYTGGAQTWTVPAGVTRVKFVVDGAQGAGSSLVPGGLGGEVTDELAVTPGQEITIVVGGAGNVPAVGSCGTNPGGFNGGGASHSNGFAQCGPKGNSGGGASDVRIGPGSAFVYPSPLDTMSLRDRVLVAGGGGGAGGGLTICNGSLVGETGGFGGGLFGGQGVCNGGAGGNQDGTSGSGLPGQGDDSSGIAGAGGGGWYGGAAGQNGSGGGGGSGHGPPGTTFETTGVHEGNGQVTITYSVPPYVFERFGAFRIPLNGSTYLNFMVANPDRSTTLTGVGFTDALPSGLVVSTPSGLSGSCGGGTITASAGSGTVALSGATISPTASCSFTVDVTGITAGLKNNTVTVTSANGGTGNTADAIIDVLPVG